MTTSALGEPGFIALVGGETRVEVVPSQGGRVRSLWMAGREWLLPDGGWEECAPAAGAGMIPAWVHGWGGVRVPEGGEARAQVPETTVATDADGHAVTMTWVGRGMPWSLTRTLVVRPDGSVAVRYAASASGGERMPFLWSASLLFPLSAKTRFHLPNGARVRVSRYEGVTLSLEGFGDSARWPHLVLDEKPRDLSRPWEVPRKTELAAWLDLGASRGQLALGEGDARLAMTCEGDDVPYLGVMLNRGGGNEGEGFGFRRAGVPSVALVPSLGAPHGYVDALGEWQAMRWLTPGVRREWGITFRTEGG